jgi:ATP-dependent Clp protease ATP-binding subunit ClpA
MEDLTILQERKLIVEANLNDIRRGIYNQVINKRVGDKVQDKTISDHAITELTRLEKMRDEFEIIKKEVVAEIAALPKPEPKPE